MENKKELSELDKRLVACWHNVPEHMKILLKNFGWDYEKEKQKLKD